MNTRDTISKHWDLIKSWRNGHKLEFLEKETNLWVEWSLDLLPNFSIGEKWRVKTPKF